MSTDAPKTGFALGGFFALMSATFAYEDPLSRASQKLVGTRAQTAYVFKEMGRNMWSSGKGFAKVGAVYSGIECCIEGVSAARRGAARRGVGVGVVCLFPSFMSAVSPRTSSKRTSLPRCATPTPHPFFLVE